MSKLLENANRCKILIKKIFRKLLDNEMLDKHRKYFYYIEYIYMRKCKRFESLSIDMCSKNKKIHSTIIFYIYYADNEQDIIRLHLN